nr:DUF1028 domain-containing protein [Ignicoccus islandicus]
MAQRAVAYSKYGIAIVQGLSSRGLAEKIAFKLVNGPEEAITEVLLSDKKAPYRQALAISVDGDWYAFTGFGTVEEKGHGKCGNVVYAGNGLKSGSLKLACSADEDPVFSVLQAALKIERRGNLWPSRSASLLIWNNGEAKLFSVNLSEDPLFELITKARSYLLKRKSARYL